MTDGGPQNDAEKAKDGPTGKMERAKTKDDCRMKFDFEDVGGRHDDGDAGEIDRIIIINS